MAIPFILFRLAAFAIWPQGFRSLWPGVEVIAPTTVIQLADSSTTPYAEIITFRRRSNCAGVVGRRRGTYAVIRYQSFPTHSATSMRTIYAHLSA